MNKQQVRNKPKEVGLCWLVLVFFFHTEGIIKFWNTLPQDIAEAKSVLGFKQGFDPFGMDSSSGGC